MVNNFAHFNNCHCIKDTIWCKELLSVKYRLIEIKGIKISSLFKKN